MHPEKLADQFFVHIFVSLKEWLHHTSFGVDWI